MPPPDPILSELVQLRAENAALRSQGEPAARRWYPSDADYRRIWDHLIAQNGLDVTRFVRLDDGRIARVGSDADGDG